LQLIIYISLSPEILLVVHCIEGAFESVAVVDREFLEHDHAGGRFFLAFVSEFAIWKGKKLISLAQHIGNQLDEIIVTMLANVVFGADATVHEDISLTTVAMHVAKHDDLIIVKLPR